MPLRRLPAASASRAPAALALALVTALAGAGCAAQRPAAAVEPPRNEARLDPQDPRFAERVVERYRELERTR